MNPFLPYTVLPSSLTLTVPSANEPVSLAQAQAQCTIDAGTDLDVLDDSLLDWIVTAREVVETYTRRTLMPSTYELSIDQFSGVTDNYCNANFPTPYRVFIPKPPLISVSKVTYIDVNSAQQILNPIYYTPNLGGSGQGFIDFYGSLPLMLARTPIVITFRAGYQTVLNPNYQPMMIAGVVNPAYDPTQPVYLAFPPACARAAIKLLVGHYYRNRESTTEKGLAELPMGVRNILSSLQWGSYS